MSRTAGSMKHLMENYKSERLTLKGFTALLRAYYTVDESLLFELNNTVVPKLSKKTGNKLLSDFFLKHPLKFTTLKKPMYFLNLHLALMKAINNDFYTPVNVEIDQNASALSILAIVLRSKEMASVCNLTGKDTFTSPYDYIRGKCSEFLETDQAKERLNIAEYDEVCEFLRNSRSLHKYAIMCFCYNQTPVGRMDDFYKEW